VIFLQKGGFFEANCRSSKHFFMTFGQLLTLQGFQFGAVQEVE
jgi:hypothetical protein